MGGICFKVYALRVETLNLELGTWNLLSYRISVTFPFISVSSPSLHVPLKYQS